MTAPRPDFAAEWFVGTVWPALLVAGGPAALPEKHYYFPQAFGLSWLAANPLPLNESEIVTLASNDGFERLPARSADADAAYAERPRTKVHGRFDAGWIKTAGQYLMRLSHYQVVFTAYESVQTDQTMGAHTDDWPVIAVQWEGSKGWWLGDQALQNTDEPTVITRPGDMLIMPKGYPHDVRTLASRSLHLATGIRLDKPVEA